MPSATVIVRANSGSWRDTGLVLGAGATLYARASGAWRQGGGSYEFPEGQYLDPTQPNPPYDPSACEDLIGSFPEGWACGNCRPFSLVLAVRPDGSGPPGSSGGGGDDPPPDERDPVFKGEVTFPPPPGGTARINDGLQANRASSFASVGPGRVWAIVNDDLAIYNDNNGGLLLTVSDQPIGQVGLCPDVANGVHLPLIYEGWLDTGVTLAPGGALTVSASGVGAWDPTFLTQPPGSPGWTYFPAIGTPLATLVGGVVPFGLVLAVSTTNPGFGYGLAKAPGCEASYPAGTFPSGGKVWIGFNDLQGAYHDNAGGFTVAISTQAGASVRRGEGLVNDAIFGGIVVR